MSNDTLNYYTILGVTPQSTIDEIKAQRNRLLQAYHPDHNKSPSANEMTKRINQAWEILSDPVRRPEYDETLKSEPTSDATRYRESWRGEKRESRRTHELTKTYAPVIQHLRRRGHTLNQVERNLFEARTGDIYYVKGWGGRGGTLPSFFGLSETILREYGTQRLHLIFYHFTERFYIDLPYAVLSDRLDQLSYQPSLRQYKVHFIERDGNVVLKELDLAVTPHYLRSARKREKRTINWKKSLKKGLKEGVRIVFVGLKITSIILIVVLMMLNFLGRGRRRSY